MIELKKIKLIMLAFLISLASVSTIVLADKADNAPAAGSSDDPLVTLSYVTEVLKPQIQAEILAALSGADVSEIIGALKSESNSGNNNNNVINSPESYSGNSENNIINSENSLTPRTSDVYQVIELRMGQKVQAISGSIEVIVRQGSVAMALTPYEQQGISDLTTGIEILNNQMIPTNHSLLIPRADGRSIQVVSDVAYVMIRGEYEIVY